MALAEFLTETEQRPTDGCVFPRGMCNAFLHVMVPLDHQSGRAAGYLSRLIRSFRRTHDAEELRCACFIVGDVLPPLPPKSLNCTYQSALLSGSDLGSDVVSRALANWDGPHQVVRWRGTYNRALTLALLHKEAERVPHSIVIHLEPQVMVRKGTSSSVPPSYLDVPQGSSCRRLGRDTGEHPMRHQLHCTDLSYDTRLP